MTAFLVHFHGDMFAGAEVFQYGLAVDWAGNDSEQGMAFMARTAQENALGSSTILSQLTESTRFTHVTAARIIDPTKSSGPGTLSAAYTAAHTSPIVGLAIGNALPPQNAVVISLQAGTYGNGSPLRGRFYMPNFDENALSAGRLDTTAQQLYLDYGVALITELRAAGTDVVPSVWSRPAGTTSGGQPGRGLGALQPITSVRVGRAVDTIRSRRGAFLEEYLSQTV